MWLEKKLAKLLHQCKFVAPTTKLRSKVSLPCGDTGKPLYATCMVAHGSASHCSDRKLGLRQSVRLDSTEMLALRPACDPIRKLNLQQTAKIGVLQCRTTSVSASIMTKITSPTRRQSLNSCQAAIASSISANLTKT